jgi:DNA-binding GntR family transcriptional regulator
MIVDGHLPPGSRITEQGLTARLGLSRTPLREALKLLAAEGLVRIEPNRGAVVARLSLAEVEEVIEVLIALERLAAALAPGHIDPAGLARIEALHAAMIGHFEAGELMGYFRTNQAIHQAIVEASGNRALARIYRAESGRIHRYRYAGNEDRERWRRAVQEHAQILDALRQRDAPLLQALMRAHLTNGWRVARARLAAELGAVPAGAGLTEEPVA